MVDSGYKTGELYFLPRLSPASDITSEPTFRTFSSSSILDDTEDTKELLSMLCVLDYITSTKRLPFNSPLKASSSLVILSKKLFRQGLIALPVRSDSEQ